MSRAFLAWGLMMGTIGLVGVLFFGFPDPEPVALFFGTAGVFLAIAAFLALTRFGHDEPPGPRAIPDASPPAALLAVAIWLALLGAMTGWWLSLIAAGLAVAAIAGLIREGRAQREALRRARREEVPE